MEQSSFLGAIPITMTVAMVLVLGRGTPSVVVGEAFGTALPHTHLPASVTSGRQCGESCGVV